MIHPIAGIFQQVRQISMNEAQGALRRAVKMP
jgi:hypothetical protein